MQKHNSLYYLYTYIHTIPFSFLFSFVTSVVNRRMAVEVICEETGDRDDEKDHRDLCKERNLYKKREEDGIMLLIGLEEITGIDKP